MPTQQNDSFLRLRDVLKIYPVSKSSWWNGVRAGIYPASVHLSERTTAWRMSDIQRLIQEKSEAAK